jgi:hypothetical protein
MQSGDQWFPGILRIKYTPFARLFEYPGDAATANPSSPLPPHCLAYMLRSPTVPCLYSNNSTYLEGRLCSPLPCPSMPLLTYVLRESLCFL